MPCRLSSTCEGTFSNSAATNSRLLVQAAADQFEGETRIAFFLYEYGRSQVKNSSSSYVDEYSITMRGADGTDTSLTGTVCCGGDRPAVSSGAGFAEAVAWAASKGVVQGSSGGSFSCPGKTRLYGFELCDGFRIFPRPLL